MMQTSRFSCAAAVVSLGALASPGPAVAAPDSPPARAGAAPSAKATATAANAAASAKWEELADRFSDAHGITSPSQDSTMRFSFPTEVRDVLVRGGQTVKKGQPLLRARDAEIIAAMEEQRIKANSDLEIKGSSATLELAQFKFDQGNKSGTLSPSELEELRIQLETTKIQLDLARRRLSEEQARFKQLEGQSERYRLEAPFDGVVEEVMVEVGQGVTDQVAAVRVVNVDRFWLDPYEKTDETIRLGLSEGSKAWVLIDLPGGARVFEGKVLYVSPVADSVSQRRRVRVEIANPGGLPAGQQARVRFSEPEKGFAAMMSVGAALRSEEGLPAGLASEHPDHQESVMRSAVRAAR